MTETEAQAVYESLLRRIRRALGHTHKNGRSYNAFGKSWPVREATGLVTFWQAVRDETEAALLWEMRVYDALQKDGGEALARERLTRNYGDKSAE